MRFSLVVALVLALAAGAWIWSGQFAAGDGKPAAKKPPVDIAAIALAPAVRVTPARAELRLIEDVVRGRTEALRKVSVKVETQGRITQLKIEQGEWVQEGQVIARLDLDDRPARLREAQGAAQPA